MTKNMHYLYNEEYFNKLEKINSLDDVKTLDLSRENEAVLSFIYPESSLTWLTELKKELGTYLYTFELYTTYPGLLIGLGNSHNIAAKEGIIGGFSFDAVTGLPVIPGSTLKGMLRSYFPEENKKDNSERELLIRSLADNEDLDVYKLDRAVFDNGDTFIGAFPVIESENTTIFKEDCLTPHKSQTKSPDILNILKVKPNVKYQFLFLLKHDEQLTAEKKLRLFRGLILLMGIGAKTNTGYGQFSETPVKQTIQNEVINHREENRQNNSGRKVVYECGKVYEGKVDGYNEKKITAYIILNNCQGKASLYFKSVGANYGQIDEKLPINTSVLVKYIGKDEKGYDQWRLV